jgi:hypothetical protein
MLLSHHSVRLKVFWPDSPFFHRAYLLTLTFIKTYDIRISRLYSRDTLGLQKIHVAMVMKSIVVEDAEKFSNFCKK